MAIIPQETTDNSHWLESIRHFFIKTRMMEHLRRSGISKHQGVATVELLAQLIGLVFLRESFHQVISRNGQRYGFAKDTAYRFLKDTRYNWEKLLWLLSTYVITHILLPLTGAERIKVLIADDTVYERRRSRCVELIGRIFDHREHRHTVGYQQLTLGWSDGNSFVPLAFALKAAAAARDQICPAARLDRRTLAAKRRERAVKPKPEVLLEMLKRAAESGIEANYVLFDSWFASADLITRISALGYGVICRAKYMNWRMYKYGSKRLTLEELSRVRGRVCQQTHFSVLVDVVAKQPQNHCRVRVLFVRNPDPRGLPIALISTDLSISEDEILRIYGKRWAIESFFKECKSNLALAREFQTRSYDAAVAHTTIVMLRYLMLMILKREQSDPRTMGELFRCCCDEMKDLDFASAFKLMLDEMAVFTAHALGICVKNLISLFHTFLQQTHPALRLGCET